MVDVTPKVNATQALVEFRSVNRSVQFQSKIECKSSPYGARVAIPIFEVQLLLTIFLKASSVALTMRLTYLFAPIYRYRPMIIEHFVRID